jgi:hypothetical protein
MLPARRRGRRGRLRSTAWGVSRATIRTSLQSSSPCSPAPATATRQRRRAYQSGRPIAWRARSSLPSSRCSSSRAARRMRLYSGSDSPSWVQLRRQKRQILYGEERKQHGDVWERGSQKGESGESGESRESARRMGGTRAQLTFRTARTLPDLAP